jgi:hypothetical protein
MSFRYKSMGNPVKKLINRDPRYTLSKKDERALYFAREKDNKALTPTELIDISATGVGLIVPTDEAPELGEILKVEFTIPNHKKVAWWARVVRADEQEVKKWWMKKEDHDELIPTDTFVALHFKELPEVHRHAIYEGIEEKFLELRKLKKERQRKEMLLFLNEHKWKLFGFLTFAIMSVMILYFLSQPSTNYDPKRGSPWGQRFNVFK